MLIWTLIWKTIVVAAVTWLCVSILGYSMDHGWK